MREIRGPTPGPVMPVTSISLVHRLPRQAPGVTGSVLERVGPASVQGDRVKYQV